MLLQLNLWQLFFAATAEIVAAAAVAFFSVTVTIVVASIAVIFCN